MYQQRFKFGAITAGFLLWAALPICAAAQTPETDKSSDVKADNTKKNKRDRAKGEPTAGQQKENSSDREVTRKIRRAVVTDKSLSTYAHNVKIITRDGAVTLKGPVHTEEEKKAIEAKATEIAGSGKVTNEIEVKGDAHKKKSKPAA